jgi:hypothetical protein
MLRTITVRYHATSCATRRVRSKRGLSYSGRVGGCASMLIAHRSSMAAVAAGQPASTTETRRGELRLIQFGRLPGRVSPGDRLRRRLARRLAPSHTTSRPRRYALITEKWNKTAVKIGCSGEKESTTKRRRRMKQDGRLWTLAVTKACIPSGSKL